MVKEFSIFKDEPATYDSVERFKEICEYSYQKDSYKHIFQVGEKIVELFCGKMHNLSQYNFIIAVAYGHDLLEDTLFAKEEDLSKFDEDFIKAISYLTRDKEKESYKDYIIKIKTFYEDSKSKSEYEKKLAEAVYYVKLADIFDHLSRIKTLKPSLKKRYLEALDILL